MKFHLSILLTFAVATSCLAQDTPKTFEEQEKEMQAWAETMLSDTSQTLRAECAEKINATLTKILKDEKSQEFEFKGLASVSIISPPDKSFRVFTWQLMITQTRYKYYGLIQTKEGKVFSLNDVSDEVLRPEIASMSDKRWYGVLYYNIFEFKKGSKTMYALLGYDSYDFFNKRKIMEILSFENGKPKFGHQVIEAKDVLGKPRTFHRYLVQYAGDAAVKFNYDPMLEMIVFDNLIGGMGPDGKPSNVPDGSFNGLKLEKGSWKLVENIFKDDPVLQNGQAPVMDRDNKSGLMGPR